MTKFTRFAVWVCDDPARYILYYAITFGACYYAVMKLLVFND